MTKITTAWMIWQPQATRQFRVWTYFILFPKDLYRSFVRRSIFFVDPTQRTYLATHRLRDCLFKGASVSTTHEQYFVLNHSTSVRFDSGFVLLRNLKCGISKCPRSLNFRSWSTQKSEPVLLLLKETIKESIEISQRLCEGKRNLLPIPITCCFWRGSKDVT